MLLEARSHGRSPSPKLYERRLISSDSSDSSLDSHEADPASLAISSTPTTSLLVTNLPTLLFSQTQDLHPLFFPFGHIEKLDVVQISPLGTMSVVVRYSQASVAQEAKESLSGQRYGSFQIEARYVKSSNPVILELDQRSSAPGFNLAQQPPLDPAARLRATEQPGLLPLEYLENSVAGGPPCDSIPGSHSRQCSVSAPFLPFSNVYDDAKNLASKPTSSRLFSFFFIVQVYFVVALNYLNI